MPNFVHSFIISFFYIPAIIILYNTPKILGTLGIKNCILGFIVPLPLSNLILSLIVVSDKLAFLIPIMFISRLFYGIACGFCLLYFFTLTLNLPDHFNKT